MDVPFDPQRAHWSETFARRADFLGADPSDPGRDALDLFRTGGVIDLLELGPGQGRDTLAFAEAGLRVTAVDFAETGLAAIRERARAAGFVERIQTVVADVRDPLPFENEAFDAAYAHMLFCMALTSVALLRLAAEVRRLLRPGGLLVYTVRTTADAHFGVGLDHGDDRWETDGFVVHFFDRALVERLATGWELVSIADHEEGRLPRRLWSITMRKPRA